MRTGRLGGLLRGLFLLLGSRLWGRWGLDGEAASLHAERDDSGGAWCTVSGAGVGTAPPEVLLMSSRAQCHPGLLSLLYSTKNKGSKTSTCCSREGAAAAGCGSVGYGAQGDIGLKARESGVVKGNPRVSCV